MYTVGPVDDYLQVICHHGNSEEGAHWFVRNEVQLVVCHSTTVWERVDPAKVVEHELALSALFLHPLYSGKYSGN